MDQNQQKQQSNETNLIQQKIVKSNGQVHVNNYQRGKMLGKGGFARCYEAINIQTRKTYAMKIVNKNTLKKSKAKQKLITEIKIHKNLNHKNVVLFDHVFEDSQNVYILLQLCTNKTLNQMIKKRKKISELEVQYYLNQLIQSLIYIHANKIIHRDLKLGNLMLSENMEIKLGDFGLAAKLEYNSEKKRTICGTPNYIAPQILEGKGHSYQVDIWSLGVIIYTLLYGRPPFETSDVKKTYKKIKQCQYTFNDQISISNNAKNLISKILIVDQSKRLTLQQILQHPFMTSNKFPKSLPSYVLNSPLQKAFIEQYTFFPGSTKATTTNPSKSVQRLQGQLEKAKNIKGISQRILLKSSVGLNRNLFSRGATKEKDQIMNQKPSLMSNNFLTSAENEARQKQILMKGSTIFVKKWVDYSSKYGLGYLLSDGSTGIYFNDSSKIVIDALNQKIDYLGKLQGSLSQLHSFSMDDLPDNRQITKKVTLMQYFRKYLNGSNGSNQNIYEHSNRDPPFCYVKKWLKNDYGILFRLNNKILQINFNDKSQYVIYCQKGVAVFTAPNRGVKTFFQLNGNQNDIPIASQAYSKMQIVKQMLRKLQYNKIDNQDDNNNDNLAFNME